MQLSSPPPSAHRTTDTYARPTVLYLIGRTIAILFSAAAVFGAAHFARSLGADTNQTLSLAVIVSAMVGLLRT